MAQADSAAASMDVDEPASAEDTTRGKAAAAGISSSFIKASNNDAKSQLPWVEKYRPER
jgi:glycerol kinase